MNSIYDQMLACSVIVEDGSGVLIQPMSDAYSYILTAKHVVQAHISEINKVRVENSEGTIITISDCLIDPLHDIAILKTSEAIISSKLIRCRDDVKVGEILHIIGYSDIRRTEYNYKDKSIYFDGQTTVRVESNVFSIALNTQPAHDQLTGISGCGVFREVDGVIYLCGVESKYEGHCTSKEFHGRVECVPLTKFDELISNNSGNYARIFPPYLLSFSHVIERTFCFNGVGMLENISFLKSALHTTIQSHITDKSFPAPIDLYNKYESKLLINQSPAEDAFNIKLWIALLEFMVIISLIDEHPIDISVLEKQESKRKFLFSATEDSWGTLLHKIFLSDLRGLGINGRVIIDAGRCDGSITPVELNLNKVISNIGRSGGGDLRIDEPITNPAKEFKFYHWKGLHRECVIMKEGEYALFDTFVEGKDATAILTKIKDDYAQFLG